MKNKEMITVQANIGAPLELVWACWTRPEHIVRWNHASDDWHTVKSEIDLKEGGRFLSRMEAKDGSMGFDFSGTFNVVRNLESLEYTLDDGRLVEVDFRESGKKVEVTEKFEPENSNPVDFQKTGWQAIMDNFSAYVESIS